MNPKINSPSFEKRRNLDLKIVQKIFQVFIKKENFFQDPKVTSTDNFDRPY